MKRNTTERPYNCGTMSGAEMRSHIVSALRGASRWWKPKAYVINKAKVGRGLYKCELC